MTINKSQVGEYLPSSIFSHS